MLMQRALASRFAKPCVFVLGLLPLAYLTFALLRDALGANPAEALLRGTGLWTLRMLCVLLLVTPLREATAWAGLARLRRMLGLFVFFYALLHFVAYVWLDQSGQWDDILRDIPQRPFILVGLLALALLLPLALTSFNAAIRWMGAARWRGLHRAVYLIALLAILHFFWMRAGKRNFDEVAIYAVIIGVLLAWRLRRRFMRTAARPETSP
jgi:sulfoxide reductase heme-binding subunit YedZ